MASAIPFFCLWNATGSSSTDFDSIDGHLKNRAPYAKNYALFVLELCRHGLGTEPDGHSRSARPGRHQQAKGRRPGRGGTRVRGVPEGSPGCGSDPGQPGSGSCGPGTVRGSNQGIQDCPETVAVGPGGFAESGLGVLQNGAY